MKVAVLNVKDLNLMLQISHLFTYLNFYVFIKGIKLFKDSAAFVEVDDEHTPHRQRLCRNILKRKSHDCSSSRLANKLCYKHNVGFDLSIATAC